MNDLLELLVDGAASSGDWPLDRGLQYGDGLFETMRGARRAGSVSRRCTARACRKAAGVWPSHADHARIWEHGAARSRQRMASAAAAAGHARASRWRAATRRLVANVPAGSSRYSRTPARRASHATVRVCTLRSRLGENPDLAGLKHCNRLEQVLARQAMAGSGAFEGLLGSSSGLLVSGTMSNVFLELGRRDS